jgi:hypothetical protein
LSSGNSAAPGGKDVTKNDVVEGIRRAIVEAALRAYDEAGIQGLCAEGRWEAAVSALRSVELEPLLREMPESPASPPETPHE